MPRDKAPLEVTPVSTVDALVKTLTDQILREGELDIELRESVLADTYGVARHTVRAALAKLSARGLLVHMANKGWAIPHLEEQDFKDLMFLRVALEVQALRTVAIRGRGIGTSAERALQDLLSTTNDDDWTLRLARDMEFHRKLVDRAGSRRLSACYRETQDIFHLYLLQRKGWFLPQSLNEWKGIHSAMVSAVLAGPEVVDRLLRATYDYSLEPETAIAEAQ